MSAPRFRVPDHQMHPVFTVDARLIRRPIAAAFPDGYVITEWLGGLPQTTIRSRALPPVPLSDRLPAGWSQMDTLDAMFGAQA